MMANEEQLAVLRQGVNVWNKWREQNSTTKIDLSGAALTGLNLAGADFKDARLNRADFRETNLERARLSLANLSRATLIGTSLNRANLKEARLAHTILMNASMRDADLSGAYLHKTVLALTDLAGAYLYNAHFGEVYLNNSKFTHASLEDTTLAATDLSLALDLEQTYHHGPSCIGMDTIRKSKGRIPEKFLRGCGLSDADIEYARLSNPDLTNEQTNQILYQMFELRAT
jgi:uncharacterized protein YjbI with pentapeptide repeats